MAYIPPRETAIAAVLALLSWCLIVDTAAVQFYPLYALVIGAIGAATATGVTIITSSRPKSYGHLQHDSARVANFVSPVSWSGEISWLNSNKDYIRKSLSASADISRSLDQILEWLERDFISTWYCNISSSTNFLGHIDSILRNVLCGITDGLHDRDIAEAVVARLVPIITDHLRDFHEAEMTVRGKKLNRNVTSSDELDLAIAGKYRNGRLHPAASLSFSDTTMIQQDYLRKLVGRLLPEFVPGNLLESRAVSVLTREIVACAVLAPLMETLSDSDSWNQIVESYGTTVLHDRKTVRKLRAALDEHASPPAKSLRPNNLPRLTLQDDENKFEKFIRAIRRCNSLPEARRFRSEITSQLRRESMLEGQDATYLRRLETGKHLLDQRVEVLSARGGNASLKTQPLESHFPTSSTMSNASIKTVLQDAAGLSYFMEYMDRQHALAMVQFWLVVEGLRDPLEDDVRDDANGSDSRTRWAESEREEIAQISDVYFSNPDLQVPADAIDAARTFLKAGGSATPAQYERARSLILRMQSSTLSKMNEQYFDGFRKSDLFYKMLVSDDGLSRPSQKSRARSEDLISRATEAKSPQNAVLAMAQGAQEGLTTTKPPHRNSSYDNLRPSSLQRLQDNTLPSSSRRSLDVNTSRPLFEDDVEAETLSSSMYGLAGNAQDQDKDGHHQPDAVEAMEAALNNIISMPKMGVPESSSHTQHHDPALFELHDERDQSQNSRKKDAARDRLGQRPNLASLGLVNTASRIGVFRDDDLFGDEEKFLEDEHADTDDQAHQWGEDEIHEAEPGDLGLAEAITDLTFDIDKLVAQDSVVDTLTKKAELTNNLAELRILNKSKASLQRELRQKELQRQQYIVQENDNNLFGRASISIKSVMVGKEHDGQEFALYVIEVQRRSHEHPTAASWAVARRYSEFHDLHQRLRHVYPAVRQLEFPRRRLVMKLQRDFLQKRRASLESYLRQLLLLPAVCRSRDLRAFLSQRPIKSNKESPRDDDQSDIVTRIFNSVTDGMDEFFGNVPVLDQLSVAGQNLISAATSQYHAVSGPSEAREAYPQSIVSGQEEQAELEAFDSQSFEPLVKPLYDIFMEAFELNRSQNWLRGRAVLVVLQQLLGSTVEKKVREISESLLSEESILKYLTALKLTLWPEGKSRTGKRARAITEKHASRREASLVFATLVPDLAGAVVGRANAQAAGRRLFATLNNGRLNIHLAFRLLDEVVAIILEGRNSSAPRE